MDHEGFGPITEQYWCDGCGNYCETDSLIKYNDGIHQVCLECAVKYHIPIPAKPKIDWRVEGF